MASISNEEINDIQKQANIVDIIGSYVDLEKKGSNYFCICPFHDDHNPSMSVNEEKGIFTCFVCHKTGNVFSFVQDFENVSFIEAVKIVAEKIGITLSEGIKTVSKYDKHYEAMNLAIKYYQNNLRSKDGSDARKYLQNRNITDEIIDEFDIGFSSNVDVLSNLLTSKGFDENILLETGLVNQGAKLYDVFKNRITFPIHNSSGKPVGISARIYKQSDEAKYVNTKETIIFKKGEILFNYHRAINEAKKLKTLIIVEGQMDAIRLYASGIKNVVATMGTALTKEHIKLLKKLNVKIVLCMDNDSAGEIATLKNGESLSEAGLTTNVLRISGAKDPDEYIIKFGADAFDEAVKASITYFDFKLNQLKKNKNFDHVDDVSSYINSILTELNKCKDDILIDLTINKLVSDYGIDKNILLNKLIKVDKKESIRPEINIKKRKKKDEQLYSLLCYYMMNDIKYIKLYEQELSFVPNEEYMALASDLLAFYIKYNYINIADFISYEVSNDSYELALSVIDEFINNELSDLEYVGVIEKIKNNICEDKIKNLKEKLKVTTDINEKLSIADEIAKLKKDVC